MRFISGKSMGLVGVAALGLWGLGCDGDLRDQIRELLKGGHHDHGNGGGAGGAGGDNQPPPPPLDLPPPHLLAPLSGSLASSAKPSFLWQLGADADGIFLEICADRGCQQIVATQQVNGAVNLQIEGTSTLEPLAPGHVFWRARSTLAGVVRSGPGPTWELFLPHRTTNLASSLGTRFDADGDGFCDFVLDGRVLRGGASGYGGSFPIPAGPPEASFTMVAAGGDLNGDGFSDVLRLDQVTSDVSPLGRWTATPLSGGAGGLTVGAPNNQIDIEGPSSSVGAAGDVNRDGYADVVFKTRFAIATYYGGVAALMTGSAPASATSQSFFTFDGDVDADGFSDAISTSNGSPLIIVSPGSPTGFSATVQTITAPPAEAPATGFLAMIDANGDGLSDLAVTGRDNALRLYAGTPFGLATAPFQVIPSAELLIASVAGDFNGDGWADLVVNHGALFSVHNGHDGGVDDAETPLVLPPSTTIVPVRGAVGDVNGDGYDDLTAAVFTADATTGRSTATGAVLFLGSASGLGVGIPVN